MGQSVIVPWPVQDFPASESPRGRAMLKVFDHLNAGGFYPTLAGKRPWSPGAARNEGARITSGDVIVFNDADTLVPPDSIRAAVELAQTVPGLVYGYTLYVRLDREGKVERELWAPPSMGSAAISRVCFEEVGGFDEAYEGWGYEDCDFAERCARLWKTRRVDGPAEHLWHGDRREDDSPEDSDPAQVDENLRRWKLRHAARA